MAVPVGDNLNPPDGVSDMPDPNEPGNGPQGTAKSPSDSPSDPPPVDNKTPDAPDPNAEGVEYSAEVARDAAREEKDRLFDEYKNLPK